MGICDSSDNDVKKLNCNYKCEFNKTESDKFGPSSYFNNTVEDKKTFIIPNKNIAEPYQIQVYGEKYNNHLTNLVTIDFINKVKISICKILYEIPSKDKPGEKDKISGTGFFMNVPLNGETFRYLITNNHVINENLFDKNINQNIILEIDNEKKINFLLNSTYRNIHFLPGQELDIAAIQIIEEDFEIIRNVHFLDYDKNYSNGYDKYINQNVFALGYPGINSISIGIGKIIGKEGHQFSPNIPTAGGHQFFHNIPTAGGSSGSPIINSETREIIGIHKGAITDTEGKVVHKMGTFIGIIVEEIKNKFDSQKKSLKDNYIWAEIDVNEYNKDREIYILNSYQEILRKNNVPPEMYIYIEEEIKNCEIEIDKKKIPFSYRHKFTEMGKHIIVYSFKKYLTKLESMFQDCSYITYLNLSKFNTKNVNDMSEMFSGCSSLSEINLDNLNTEKVTNMSGMFAGCKNLINLDLSSFNTKNVSDMNSMFYDCLSLKEINLSSFNTGNVTNMWGMFFHCSSLSSLDLSSFNTMKVTDMNWMFNGCKSLLNVNLSSFNTKNVIGMDLMFYECSNLKKLDLSNFNTENVKIMNLMFCQCSSLLSLDLSNFNTKNVTKYGVPTLDKPFLTIPSSAFNLDNNLCTMFLDCSPNLFKNIRTKDKNILEVIKNIH